MENKDTFFWSHTNCYGLKKLNSMLLNHFLKTEVQLIYKVVLVPGVQQSDSVTYR